MKWLTFLDFSLLQATSKNIESKLEVKEKEISYLREREINNSDQITLIKLKHEQEMKDLHDRLDRIISMMQENPKLARVKREVLSTV